MNNENILEDDKKFLLEKLLHANTYEEILDIRKFLILFVELQETKTRSKTINRK